MNERWDMIDDESEIWSLGAKRGIALHGMGCKVEVYLLYTINGQLEASLMLLVIEIYN